MHTLWMGGNYKGRCWIVQNLTPLQPCISIPVPPRNRSSYLRSPNPSRIINRYFLTFNIPIPLNLKIRHSYTNAKYLNLSWTRVMTIDVHGTRVQCSTVSQFVLKNQGLHLNIYCGVIPRFSNFRWKYIVRVSNLRHCVLCGFELGHMAHGSVFSRVRSTSYMVSKVTNSNN